mmetsp:Transcript_44038/g.99501  ORF Transcript_44038/g.99501 Transcript_44038/m.99501 type:complete len:224 (-) Transcript_44038:792-1463(-)
MGPAHGVDGLEHAHVLHLNAHDIRRHLEPKRVTHLREDLRFVDGGLGLVVLPEVPADPPGEQEREVALGDERAHGLQLLLGLPSLHVVVRNHGGDFSDDNGEDEASAELEAGRENPLRVVAANDVAVPDARHGRECEEEGCDVDCLDVPALLRVQVIERALHFIREPVVDLGHGALPADEDPDARQDVGDEACLEREGRDHDRAASRGVGKKVVDYVDDGGVD